MIKKSLITKLKDKSKENTNLGQSKDKEYIYSMVGGIGNTRSGEFEDTKGVIRIRKSKTDRQHNGHRQRTGRILYGM